MEIYLGKLNSSAKKEFFLKYQNCYIPLNLKKSLVRSFDFDQNEDKELNEIEILEKLGFDSEKFDKAKFYEGKDITLYEKIFSFKD